VKNKKKLSDVLFYWVSAVVSPALFSELFLEDFNKVSILLFAHYSHSKLLCSPPTHFEPLFGGFGGHGVVF
jgi:hypothetical protein